MTFHIKTTFVSFQLTGLSVLTTSPTNPQTYESITFHTKVFGLFGVDETKPFIDIGVSKRHCLYSTINLFLPLESMLDPTWVTPVRVKTWPEWLNSVNTKASIWLRTNGSHNILPQLFALICNLRSFDVFIAWASSCNPLLGRTWRWQVFSSNSILLSRHPEPLGHALQKAGFRGGKGPGTPPTWAPIMCLGMCVTCACHFVRYRSLHYPGKMQEYWLENRTGTLRHGDEKLVFNSCCSITLKRYKNVTEMYHKFLLSPQPQRRNSWQNLALFFFFTRLCLLFPL